MQSVGYVRYGTKRTIQPHARMSAIEATTGKGWHWAAMARQRLMLWTAPTLRHRVP